MAFTAYCTVAQVEAHGTPHEKAYNTTQKPTITDVENECAKIYRRINAALAKAGITVPVSSVTSPLAYALMTDLNSLGAAAQAWKRQYGSSGPKKSERGAELWAQFEKDLADYCEDTDSLQDASGVDSGNTVLSRTADLKDTDLTSDTIDEYRHYRGQEW
jgi:hypothetical protein